MNFDILDHWEKINLPHKIGGGRAEFAHGPEGKRIEMSFFKNTNDQSLEGYTKFAPVTQGPPGYVHGGLLAFVLDEAMGSSTWMHGHKTVAANININFIDLAPVDKNLFIKSEITSIEGKKIYVRGKIQFNEKDLVTSEGLFIMISGEMLNSFNKIINS